MSSTTATAAAPAEARPVPRPTLSASLCAFLRIVTRGADRGAVLRIDERGSSQHRAVVHVKVRDVGASLPEPVLNLLERSGCPWHARIAVLAGGAPASISALVVRAEFRQTYTNPARPGSPHGKRWIFPLDEVRAWTQQLDALAAPPTMTLYAMPLALAVWALAAPLPVRTAQEQGAALDALRRLAGALGGIAPGADETLGEIAAPLIGTKVANQHFRVVEASQLDEARIYQFSAIADAIRKAAK